MSLDKAIKYGKEHRKEYFDSRGVDPFCRNHGKCIWCRDNRTFKNQSKIIWTKQLITEYLEFQNA